jgi:hypothetical protein
MQHLSRLKIVHRDIKMLSILSIRQAAANLELLSMKGETNEADSLKVYLRPERHYSLEVLKNQEFKFAFACDVYLLAIFCYEVIEGRVALFAGGRNTAVMKKFMIAGGCPQWTATAAQQELV